MGIISCSLDEETEDKIDFIQGNSAFDGRSELIRKAISDLYLDTKQKKGVSGEISAAVFVEHDHENEHRVSEIAHRTDDIILTQLHHRLDEQRCLEIFLVESQGSEVVRFYDNLNGSKATDTVRLILQS